MMKRIIGLCMLCTTTAFTAEPVIGYRNNGTGAYPDADPPMVWSPVKNVVWRRQISDLILDPISLILVKSANGATGKIFTTAFPMRLICLDRDTGAVVWERAEHAGPTLSEVIEKRIAFLKRDHRMLLLSTWLRERDSLRYHLEYQTPLDRFSKTIQEMTVMKRKGETAVWATDHAFIFFKEQEAALAAQLEIGAADKDAHIQELGDLRKQRAADTGKSSRDKIDFFEFASGSTPASDGERVVALFYPGLVVCYDLNGNLLWNTVLVSPKGGIPNGRAIAPEITDGKVLIDCSQFITCLDLATGKVLWTTPWKIPSFHNNSPVIGCAGGQYYFMANRGVVGRLSDGEILVQTPQASAHVRQYWSAGITPDRKTFHAVTHAVRLTDDPAKPVSMLWELDPSLILQEKEGRDKEASSNKVVLFNHNYAGPAVVDGKIYYFNSGIFSKSFYNTMDAETGAVLVKHVEGADIINTYSNPIYAGKYLYHFEGNGLCKIRDPNDNFKLVGANLLEPGLNAIPVFVGRRMYIRTDLAVYCIEESPERKAVK